MSRWPRSLGTRRPAVYGIDAARIAWHDADAVRVAGHREAASALGALRGPVDFVTGNDLAVHWVQQPPAAVRSLQELQLVAAARCAHLHGGSPADWWVAADWSLRHPFVCAALPRATIQPLQQAAPGARLQWHTAFSVLARHCARTIPDDGWSAQRTPARVLLWHCTRGRADALTGFAVAADATRDMVDAQLQVQLQLEAAVTGSATGEGVHWCTPAPETAKATTEAESALGLGQLLRGGPA